MKRRPDWHERLSAVINAARERTFAWGEHDCALFTAECVEAMTGKDFSASARRHYSTAVGAARVLTRRGYSGIGDLCSKSLGEPLPNALHAQRGDVVLLDGGNGAQLGICIGDVAITPSENDGLIYIEMSRWLTAWRV